jgi:cytochrome c-type biogenesis protein CcmH
MLGLKMKRLILLMLLFPNLLLATPIDIYPFNSPDKSQRFEALTHELRCLVCQNQSLAESDAGLAQDLRHKIYIMVNEGKSDKEIKDYMANRYGPFILFSPPFNWKTGLLWLFPMFLIILIFSRLLLKKRKIGVL